MGEGNKKLSKRDPQGNLLNYREDGFLPEGLLNYLALLGWAISGDRDIFSIEEMVAAFEIGDVNPNPARFDIKKAEAINAAHMRLLSVEEIGRRSVPVPRRRRPRRRPADRRAAERCSTPRCRSSPSASTSSPSPSRCWASCFVDEAAFALTDEIDDAGPRRRQGGVRRPRRAAGMDDGRHRGGAARRARRGPRAQAAQRVRPVRIAVTGRKVSPPLFESLELLGRERSLARLSAALA